MTRLKKSKILAITVYALLVCAVVGVVINLTTKMQTRALPSGSIALSTEYSQYLLGEEIRFVITNNYNSPIYVRNSCPNEPLEVYKLEGEKWIRQHDTATEKECTMSDRSIEIAAQTQLTSNFNSWPHLFDKPGKYRIATYIDYYDSIPYTDFEVVEKPAVTPAASNASTPAASLSQTSTNTTSQASATPESSAPALQSKTITLSQGDVMVEYSSSTIYVRSISPASGYTYEGGGNGKSVEITFKGKGKEVQLQLSLRNGQIVQKIESD